MIATPSGVRHPAAALLIACALPASAQSTATSATAAPSFVITVQGKRELDNNTKNGSTTVIGADQLTANNATDMSNIARYAPLISVPSLASGSGNIWDGSGNAGFNIRGVEGNRISMDLDGIALPDAAPKPDGTTTNGFGIGRDYFDPETFREVRIGSGTSPAGPGTPGLGGAVSFVTKAPEDYLNATRSSYADYKFGYSSATSARMHAVTAATTLGPDLKALLLGVHRDGSEQKSLSSVPLNPDDWNSDAILAKLNWTPAPGQKLGFTIDDFKSDHQLVYANKLGASYPEGATQDARTERTRYSIEHQYTGQNPLFDTLDSRLYAQNSSVLDLTSASYISGGQPTFRNINTGFYNNAKGLTVEAGKQLAANQLLSYGLSYEQQQSRRPWTEDRLVIKTGAHQVTIKNRMADMDTDQLSAYLRGEFGFSLAGYSATLTPGLRGEQRTLTPQNLQAYLIAVPGASREIRKETDSFFTPSLNLSVALTPTLNVYGQYARGTRLPTAAERTGTYDSFSYTGAGNGYAVLGNPDLQKETSNAFELGLKGALTPKLELSFALFQTRYSNFIEYAPQPPDPVNYPTITYGLYRPENLGSARTWGGEMSARYAMGRGFSVALAGGIQRGSAQNTQTGKQGELASALPYKANATLAYDDPQARAGTALVISTVRGKQASDDVIANTSVQRFAVPGSTTADLTAYWNISKHAALTFGIYNIGDKKYWDYASSHGLPAATSAATLADIERQARPGRNYASTLKIIY